MTNRNQELAKQYFEAYPGKDVLHVSSDGQVFFQENYNDAVNHQRRIDQNVKVDTIYKKKLYAETGSEDEEPVLPKFPPNADPSLLSEEEMNEWNVFYEKAKTSDEFTDEERERIIELENKLTGKSSEEEIREEDSETSTGLVDVSSHEEEILEVADELEKTEAEQSEEKPKGKKKKSN